VKKRAIRLTIPYLIGIWIAFMLVFPSGVVAAEQPSPQVLIINSYHVGDSWADNELNGILSVFRERMPGISPAVEFLDTKRFPDAEHLTRMKQYLQDKYRDRQIDLVIVLDNPAYELILQNRQDLFPKVPVVFAGVDNFKPQDLAGQSRITGVSQDIDILGTIEMALALDPTVKYVFAVHDYTTSGLAMRKEVEAVIPRLEGKVEVTFSPEMSFDELTKIIEQLPDSSIILLLTYVTDAQGRVFSRAESTQYICQNSPVPVYSIHKAYLGYGIVGGKLLDGVEHGRQAARLALQLLKGKDAGKIAVEKSVSRPFVDYRLLSRFDLKEENLPPGTAIVNRPVTWWETYQHILLPGLIIIGVLSLLTVFLTGIILRLRRAESQLRHREHDFATLVENAADIIMRFDTNLRLLYVNPVIEQQLGFSLREITGKTPAEISPSSDLVEEFPAALRRVLETGVPHEIEQSIPTQGGEKCFQTRIVPEFSSQGKIESLLAIGRDITERKRSEKVIRESEERYRFLIENIDKAVIVVQDERIRFANVYTQTIAGYPDEELLKKPFIEFIHPEDRDLVYQRYLQRVQGKDVSSNYSFRIIHGSGQVRWVELKTVLIEWEGKPATLNFLSDITERKQAEESLRKSEEKFARAFRSSPYAMIITRPPDGRIVDVNDKFTVLSGYSREEVIGKTTRELNFYLDSVDRDYIISQLQRFGQIADYECRFRLKSGEIFTTLFSAVNITIGDELCILSSILDITERKRTEEALKQKIAELERFNNLTVDRELRMIDLKKEVNDLLKQLGLPEKYRIIE